MERVRSQYFLLADGLRGSASRWWRRWLPDLRWGAQRWEEFPSLCCTNIPGSSLHPMIPSIWRINFSDCFPTLSCVSVSLGQGRSTSSGPIRLTRPSDASSISTMPSPTITRTAEPPQDWEPFARAHGTFYHQPEWAICIRDMYRLRLECYSARVSGQLRGLLAVADVPGLLGPRRLVSLPFSYAAGPLALDGSPGDALLAAVRESARDRRFRRVEIK